MSLMALACHEHRAYNDLNVPTYHWRIIHLFTAYRLGTTHDNPSSSIKKSGRHQCPIPPTVAAHRACGACCDHQSNHSRCPVVDRQRRGSRCSAILCRTKCIYSGGLSHGGCSICQADHAKYLSWHGHQMADQYRRFCVDFFGFDADSCAFGDRGLYPYADQSGNWAYAP